MDLTRPATSIAPALLGALVTARLDGESVTVRLTEVEAYEGGLDPASHAFRGPSRRNATMFGEPGHLYVYRHLGLHHCANLVLGEPGRASAVLLRAGEVVDGVEPAYRRRRAGGTCARHEDLARGPARLAVALGLDLRHDGAPVAPWRPGAEIAVTLGTPSGAIRTGPRVGVGGVGADAERFAWRYWLDGDPHVSAYRMGRGPRGSG